MPRGVYQRHAGFGEANRQRGARRRELQERQAQEIERLRAHVERQRLALVRATQLLADHRAFQKGIATLATLLPTWGEGRATHLRVLLGSFAVGAHAGRVAAVTGLPLRVVREIEHPLRRSGIWVADQLVQRWAEPRGGQALLSDLAVAQRRLYRDPADPTRYGKKAFPPVTTWSRPTPGRTHRKGDVREIDTCGDCQRRPAFMGVCGRHLETTRTGALAARLGIKPDTLAKRRMIAAGRCRSCGLGPIVGAGFCHDHFAQHRAGNARRHAEAHQRPRRWAVSRDDVAEADADLFDRLLADLLRSVQPFPTGHGRPRHPIGVVLFAVVTMARANASTRGVQPILDAAIAAGDMPTTINSNTLIRYLGADVGTLLTPTRAVLAAVNVALAELGIEPGYPTAAAPIAVSAEASPVWMRLLGVAATRRQGRAVDLGARPAVDDEGSVELILGRIVRSLGKLAAVVRERGIEGWLVVGAPGSDAASAAVLGAPHLGRKGRGTR